MEKVVTINGQELRLKSTGATPIRYKSQFNRDFLKDVISLQHLKALDNMNMEELEFEGINTTILYNIIYIFAKTADKEIGDLLSFYDSYDSFPIFEVFMEAQDLLMSSLAVTKKK